LPEWVNKLRIVWQLIILVQEESATLLLYKCMTYLVLVHIKYSLPACTGVSCYFYNFWFCIAGKCIRYMGIFNLFLSKLCQSSIRALYCHMNTKNRSLMNLHRMVIYCDQVTICSPCCKIWGFHGSVNVDYLLGCVSMLYFGCVPKFQRNILPPPSSALMIEAVWRQHPRSSSVFLIAACI
jgi:hypothetical protein